MATFNGTAAGETFVGGSGDDIADGAGGNDILKGNGGRDILFGGVGSDTIEGGSGDDFLASFSADANFSQYPYSDSIALDIYADVDALDGGIGDDFISAGFGDTVIGGAGRDGLIISFQGASSGITVDFSQLYWTGSVTVGGATISGIEGVPYVEGSEFDDVITGHNGDYFDFTKLYGRGGNDHLIADYKCDLLDGGDGDDLLDGRYSSYLSDVYGGNGNDTILVGPSSWARIWGGNGADTIDAGYGEVHGDGGNDTINARYSAYGEAQIFGDDGNDILNGDDGDSYLFGGAGADKIYGNDGNDLLRAGDGNVGNRTNIDNGLEIDRLFGGAGNDDIGIGYGDYADGGAGFDKLSISLAAAASGVTLDTGLIASGATVTLFGGTITGFERIGTIEGTAFNDRITIGTQTTTAKVVGGNGNDVVTSRDSAIDFDGGTGNDSFVDGLGADTIDGGAGSDTINYVRSSLGVVVTMGAADGSWGFGPGGDVLRNVENITGSRFDDQIVGSDAVNRLLGGVGDDLIDGGAGNDRLDGGAGVDTASYASAKAGVTVSLAISSRQDTIGAGRDVLVRIEKLIGSQFGDLLIGTGADDDLDGAAGDDILRGGAGNDILRGGAGNGDQASYADAANGVNVQIGFAGAQNTGWGMDALIDIEGAIGSQFNDTLTGNGAANILEGGGGNDQITGGGGRDTASYAGAASGIRVSLGVTVAQDTLGAGIDTLSSMENLRGSAFNDDLKGTAGANIIDGGAGDDTIRGINGSDTLLGGVGNDQIFSGFGNDTIDGGIGRDTLTYELAKAAVTVNLSLNGGQATGMGTDTITNIENLVGSKFNDRLTGSENDDIISGGLGNDLIEGDLGNDKLDGGAGIDTLSFFGTDYVFVRADLGISGAQDTGVGTKTITGFENVIGSQWSDLFKGDAAANRLDGGEGSDTLYGRDGNDILIGGNGDDFLFGGNGTDSLTGGAGMDHFCFEDPLIAANVDTIEDFNASEDMIHLSHYIFKALYTGPAQDFMPQFLQAGAFRTGAAAADLDDRIIYNSITGALYYDPDGIGAKAAVLFASLDSGLALTNVDFYIY